MRKYILIISISVLMIATLSSFYFRYNVKKTPQEHKIQWLTLEQAFAKTQKQPKKIFVDVYTDWCGWCVRMDQTTFSLPIIAQYMNEKYYCVKLNAEQKEDIVLGNDTFKFVPQGGRGYHQAAAALLQGKMSYPTVVFLDEAFKMIQPVPGFQAPENFHKIAIYFGENYHKSLDWNFFNAKFDSLLSAKK
jgi:thioredoxin-related protein